MAEFELFRFEKQLLQVCSETLKAALNLVGYKLVPKVFLLAFDPRHGFVTIVNDEHDFDTTEFEQHLSDFMRKLPEFPEEPDDPAVSTDAWGKAFKSHADYLSDCWGGMHEFVTAEMRTQLRMASVSSCWTVNQRVVAIIATYSQIEYDHYPHLDIAILREDGRWPSLPYTIVEVVLNKFAEELKQKDAGRQLRFDPDSARELARKAGAIFLQSNALFNKDFTLGEVMARSTSDFYEVCNAIAGMRYESREGFNSMVIAKPGHLAAGTEIELQEPFPVTEIRRVRKFLEMCQGELSLLTDSKEVWGWAKYDEKLHLTQTADVLIVRFVGQSHWRLLHRNEVLMEVVYGEPRLPRPPADPAEVKAQIEAKFTNLPVGASDKLVELVKHAMKADHGTMLIASANAATEAARLTKSTKGIKPFTPNETTIVAASAIDGGILVDLAGECHGIGIILDGEAGDGENPARGARFNSAIRYLRKRPDSLIAVVSEDKTVDIVTYPALPPTLKKELPMSTATTDPILEALKDFIRGFKARFEKHLADQKAPPDSKFLLLHCIDYRYPSLIHFAIDEVLPLRYDQVVLAGASLAGVIDFGPPGPKLHWSQTLVEHVLLSQSLHSIAAILVLEHRGCGAYKEFAHVPDHPDPVAEEQEHARQYQRFVELLARNIPDDPKFPKIMMEAHLLGDAPHKKDVIRELSPAKLLK